MKRKEIIKKALALAEADKTWRVKTDSADVECAIICLALYDGRAMMEEIERLEKIVEELMNPDTEKINSLPEKLRDFILDKSPAERKCLLGESNLRTLMRRFGYLPKLERRECVAGFENEEDFNSYNFDYDED